MSSGEKTLSTVGLVVSATGGSNGTTRLVLSLAEGIEKEAPNLMSTVKWIGRSTGFLTMTIDILKLIDQPSLKNGASLLIDGALIFAKDNPPGAYNINWNVSNRSY